MLDENNKKAELSYAYLHAVSAAAGFDCGVTSRHLDSSAVDAQVNIRERLDPGAILFDFSLHFQLKATSGVVPLVGNHLSFPLDVVQYDKLRETAVAIPKLILLMTLPANAASWVHVSEEQLITRYCARWTCIKGAPDTENTQTINIKFDVANILTPEALRSIARRVALGEELV